MLDVDGNGSVSFDEMCTVMTKNGQSHSQEALKEMFMEFDLNNDGKITFDEFEIIMNFVKKGPGENGKNLGQGNPAAKTPTTADSAKTTRVLGSIGNIVNLPTEIQ